MKISQTVFKLQNKHENVTDVRTDLGENNRSPEPFGGRHNKGDVIVMAPKWVIQFSWSKLLNLIIALEYYQTIDYYLYILTSTGNISKSAVEAKSEGI